jgi:septal ring factor EnvC (AmiA/AmiB activator)
MSLESLESLKLLETKVGEFVDRHEQIRREQEQLRAQLRERDKKLAEAGALLKRYEKERTEMKSRLERILGRLNGLELS